MNLIVRHMICMSVVCSTAVIVPTYAGPINFLKGMVGHKKANNGTTRSKPAISSTVAAVTFSGVRVHKATDTVKRLPTEKIADTADRDNNVDRNTNDNNDNAVLQRLCSAVLFAVTMSQCRREATDVNVNEGSTVTVLAKTTAAAVALGRQQQQSAHRKVLQEVPAAAGRHRKRFPPPPIGTGLSAHAWHTKPAHAYRDPILAQETSRGVDYLTSYPLAKDGGGGGGTEHEEKYYEDVERPAKVWKIKVASEPMAKSSKNSAATDGGDDDDDDDDEMAAADNNNSQ